MNVNAFSRSVSSVHCYYYLLFDNLSNHFPAENIGIHIDGIQYKHTIQMIVKMMNRRDKIGPRIIIRFIDIAPFGSSFGGGTFNIHMGENCVAES